MDDSNPNPINATTTMGGSSSSFPRSPSEFDDDPRVSFSKLENKYILETDDGEEYFFDSVLKRWVPSLDEALIEQQREAYKVPGVEENEEANVKQQRMKNKRKKDANGGDEGSKPKKARVNTAVYVTSLPLDASVDEVRDVFCKCGVIAEEIDSHRPRIKMYTDDEGKFKGDALVVYFRPESVNLAVQMLDDTDFRFGETGPQGKMKVQPADFSFKAQQDAPVQKNTRERAKIIRKTQRLNNKLTDWDDEDPSKGSATAARWEKVMILKHMFTQKELEEDPAAILDIKEDIREECSKVGNVTNVVLYDQEPDGVVSVRFSEPEQAKACVQMMNGRFFAGTRVEAYIADGTEKFRRTNEKRAAIMAGLDGDDVGWEGGAEADEARRLDKFGSWLESEAKEGKKETEQGKEKAES